jgi:hypothetical protein
MKIVFPCNCHSDNMKSGLTLDLKLIHCYRIMKVINFSSLQLPFSSGDQLPSKYQGFVPQKALRPQTVEKAFYLSEDAAACSR